MVVGDFPCILAFGPNAPNFGVQHRQEGGMEDWAIATKGQQRGALFNAGGGSCVLLLQRCII